MEREGKRFQKGVLGIIRTDYFSEKAKLKMIELNTIACAGGVMAD